MNLEKALQTEEEELRREKVKTIQPSSRPVDVAKWIWIVGAIILDIGTAFLVYQITALPFYGVVWFFAGAVGLIWSDYQKERIGNNATQREIGELGIYISGGSVLVMAIFAGIVYELRVGSDVAVIVVVVMVFSLFFYHLVQAYRYRDLDDELRRMNDDARAHEKDKKKLESLDRIEARLVDKMERERRIAEYKRKYGENVFNAAMRIYGDANNNAVPDNMEMPARVSYAANIEHIANKPIKSRKEEIDALGEKLQDPKS